VSFSVLVNLPLPPSTESEHAFCSRSTLMNTEPEIISEIFRPGHYIFWSVRPGSLVLKDAL
jgi:hypothetical protein